MTLGSAVLNTNIGRKVPSLSEFKDHVRLCIAIFLNGVLPR